MKYDAVLILGFGGPEKMDDVVPFLENVLRGKNVPTERFKEVVDHYELFAGVSPINAQNRELTRLLQDELRRRNVPLPVYWGNRNWHPYLSDTLRDMQNAGVRRAIAYVTSAFSSYSGCRQYLEDIERARTMLGPDAPIVDKLRVFFNHPFFIEVHAKKIQLALDSIAFAERSATSLVFSAHSIPLPMSSTCEYVSQLFEACRLVADAIDTKRWQLAYQSRSGPPSVPWLEPDISTVLRALRSQGDKNVVISPIGFVSDHMEVIYDLDTEAKQLSQDIGLHMVRASTPGHDPLFIAMLGDLVEERLSDQPHRKAIGRMIASHDVCPPNCCNSHGRSL